MSITYRLIDKLRNIIDKFFTVDAMTWENSPVTCRFSAHERYENRLHGKMSHMSTRDWTRLGEYVRRRRHDELHLTQLDVMDRGGPSTVTQRNIERGKNQNYRSSVFQRLEDVLGWDQGSCLAILDGREPRLAVAVRLGKLLVDRRLFLGGLDRDLWAAQQGLDLQLVYDVEHGIRADYSLRELSHLNRAYRLQLGAIRRFLADEVTELAVSNAAAPPPAADDAVSDKKMEALAQSAMTSAQPFIDQILAEMEENGGVPQWSSAKERENWEVLKDADMPLEELVSNAAWWRMQNFVASAASETRRRRAEKTA
jgi:hypothetical protein